MWNSIEGFSKVENHTIGLVTRVSVRVQVIGEFKQLSCAGVFFSKAMLVSKEEMNVLRMSHNMRIHKTCFMSSQGTLVREMGL